MIHDIFIGIVWGIILVKSIEILGKSLAKSEHFNRKMEEKYKTRDLL